jgi:hypothetical protein
VRSRRKTDVSLHSAALCVSAQTGLTSVRKTTSVFRTKDCFKHLRHPTRFRKGGCLGLRHKSDLQNFGSVRLLRTGHMFGLKHSHHIRSAMSVAITNYEFGTAEDAD